MSSAFHKAMVQATARQHPSDPIIIVHPFRAGPLRRRRVREMGEVARAHGVTLRVTWLSRSWLVRDAEVHMRGEWPNVLNVARLWGEVVGR